MDTPFQLTELGYSPTLEDGIAETVRRVFDDAGLSTRGAWAVDTDANVDLDTCRITLHITIAPADVGPEGLN